MLEGKTQWVGDNLWVLLNLDNAIVARCFPFHTWEALSRTRRKYKTKIKKGVAVSPERPEWYTEGMSPDEIFERLQNVQQPLGELAVAASLFTPEQRQALHDELDKVLDKANINPHEVSGFDVLSGTYQQGSKNDETGETTVTTLARNYVRLTHKKGKEAEEEREFVSIQRYESEGVHFNPNRYRKGQWRRTAVLPDFQIGYWRNADGELVPYHDEAAIDVMLQVLSEQNKADVDHIVILGDFLDLPMFGKYRQHPEWAGTLNKSLEYGHKLLKTIREMFPNARMSMLEGNHDARLANDIKDHYAKIHGIKRMGVGEEVLTVPYLLGLDTLGVEYAGGYPAGRIQITPRLQAIHGEIVKKGGTAKAVTEYEGVSTIHGHTHRYETYGRTVRTLGGMRQTYAFSPGTLSAITGEVPSVHGAVTARGPVENPEDWQQGFAFVDHDGDKFQYNQVFISTPDNHTARFEGKTYVPLKRKRK